MDAFDVSWCNQHYFVPSTSRFRDGLTRIDPQALDQALSAWSTHYADDQEGLAIDGKTLCNAIDQNGRQTHVLSLIGHHSGQCYAQ